MKPGHSSAGVLAAVRRLASAAGHGEVACQVYGSFNPEEGRGRPISLHVLALEQSNCPII